jgi:hypothetical protein
MQEHTVHTHLGPVGVPESVLAGLLARVARGVDVVQRAEHARTGILLKRRNITR